MTSTYETVARDDMDQSVQNAVGIPPPIPRRPPQPGQLIHHDNVLKSTGLPIIHTSELSPEKTLNPPSIPNETSTNPYDDADVSTGIVSRNTKNFDTLQDDTVTQQDTTAEVYSDENVYVSE
uniref:Uncharacterized protein n=1 Tax=Lygus hesperus TaxID=30085 RepID=A0A0A9Z3D1_LYGHE